MKRKSLLNSLRLPALVLALVGLALVGVNMRASALKGGANNSPSDGNKIALQIQLRNGLGSQVRLDKVKNTPGHIKQAVDSAARFIESRSGLVISESVKNRLAALEQRALASQGRRVGADELIDILTTTTVERLSSLTDAEIGQAGAALNNNGEIILRANGEGGMKSAEFEGAAKKMRALSRQGDETFKGLVRAAIQVEVQNRLDAYSEALPRHFGRAKRIGVTPLQAVLFAYSVASDDFMGDSQETLNAKQEMLYAELKGQGHRHGRKPNKAYGSDGYLFAVPLDLILNEATMNKLLDRVGERGAK